MNKSRSNIEVLLSDPKFLKNPGAPTEQIERFEMQMHVKLPRDYVRVLQFCNGGEGPVGEEGYLMLWGIDELMSLNRDYEVEEYAPGLLLFGSNGGGEAFAFDTRSDEMPIVSVPFIGMDLKSIWKRGPDFEKFLDSLGKGE